MKVKIGFTLVLLMALLQAFYAVFAYLDPTGFSALRGTELVSTLDSDWVRIYASRTLFVALIVGLLLYLKEYKTLAAVALIGTVIPVTDGWLAYAAGASSDIVIKHAVVTIYLIFTAALLFNTMKPENTS